MMDAALQAKLNLPLPKTASDDERNEALRLLRRAIERLRIDRDDTSGLTALQSYAAGCHIRARIKALAKS